MNKSRIKPVKSGRNIRMSYSRQKEVLEMPNLIEVQKNLRLVPEEGPEGSF